MTEGSEEEMEQIKLDAHVRTLKGKSGVKKLREEGLCPCVVYKALDAGLPLEVSSKGLSGALKTSAGANVIINLSIKQDTKQLKERTVIVKELQREPLNGGILHADFYEISLTELIKVTVSLLAKGEAPGVKESGILQYVLREVEVECLPTHIPQKIEVDVSNLNIADSIFVKDLVLPEGVKVLNDPSLIAISIEPPMKEEVAAPVAAEGAVAAEPEVIREKKLTPEELAAQAEEEKGKEAKPDKEKK